MTEIFAALQGEVILPEALSVPRAREVADFLLNAEFPYAEFREARRFSDGQEAVVFDVRVEVGQEPSNDIRPVERIAVKFDQSDGSYPDVLALRMSFPSVPHVNLRADPRPASLCLYDEPWADIQIRWTAPTFVERIREWLALTADGTLHGEDQPLEPILLGPFNTLVLPSEFASITAGTKPEHLYVRGRDAGPRGGVLMATQQRVNDALDLVAVVVRGEPQTHGTITSSPRTLNDLHHLLAGAGVDLLAYLETTLFAWEKDAALLNAKFVIVAFLPKTRTQGGEVESVEVRAFASPTKVADLGVAIGIWEMNGMHPGRLIPRDPSKRGEAVQVEVLNTVFELSREKAALLNGLSSADARRITAIGVGALGSQTICNLIKAGYGTWSLIDDDYLLPHNAARHALSSNLAGFPKAEVFSAVANCILEEPAISESITANVLGPGDKAAEVARALKDADVIADFSANVSVSRYLAANDDAPHRRVCLFLNPTGTDLVLLCEDEQREITLDHLEMQYYRELLRNPELGSHLADSPGRIRYAQSCRDLASTVPQDMVALHAAIGARALRNAVSDTRASIALWSATQDLTVKKFDVQPVTVTVYRFGQWTLCLDDLLLQTIRDSRTARLPNETGGVLIGAFDFSRKVAYVVDTIPSPPDSEEWPTLYIRGSTGLRAKVESAERKTKGMLHYVGEWHSHPDGYSCAPSDDDRKVFEWLAGLRRFDGAPALMAIAGEDQFAWFLEFMP